MTPGDNYQQLARYNRWMNERIYAVAAELSDEERKRDLGAFFGSIHLTLTHILIADRAWLARLTGDRDTYAFRDSNGEPISVTALGQNVYDDFGELSAARAQTDALILDFALSLTTAFLAGPIRYRSSDGEHFEHPAWWCVTHLFNHHAHHRGQVTTLLKQLGRDPGVTDFVAFVRSDGQV